MILIVITPLSVVVPTLSSLRTSHPPSDTLLLDRTGRPLDSLRTDATTRRLPWTALSDISPALQRAVIRAEDRRFMGHAGVDWLAAAGALRDRILGRPLRGASTITMQLATLADPAVRAAPPRSLTRKWRQTRAALALERTWQKADLLEAYLNLASFRGELSGIAAAARGLFDKEPHGLSDAESLVLAALLRAPNAAPAAVAARACALDTAQPCDALTSLVDRSLAGRPRIEPRRRLAPHLAQRLLAAEGPAHSARPPRTSLVKAHQEHAVAVLRSQLAALAGRNVNDAAALVVQNDTGEVLAYVGHPDPGVHVDLVRARRQAGSTLKPFLYARALDTRLLTAATLLDDSPLEIATPLGNYRPRNYDRVFHGPVSVRTALASSMNVPAVRALLLVGADEALATLRAFGFTAPQDAAFYGPSLALGSLDVTLWELVQAYRGLAALAAGGRPGGLVLTPGAAGAPLPSPVSPAAAFVTADILADREARAPTFGLENHLSTRFFAAVKTGTSKDMRDNWCVGWSQRYTVGVWVGNRDGEPMWNVSGVSGAAPAWLRIMTALHEGEPSAPPPPPHGLTRALVGTARGERPEWFLAATAQAAVEPLAAAATEARISYPAAGTVVAFDPDLPPELQRLVPEAEPASPAHRWRLNGRALGPLGVDVGALTPGPHVISLHDAEGRELDRVRIVHGGRAAAG